MNATTKHLESIGHLCASLQAPYARIRRAVDALGIEPEVTINGVPHFNEEQCERIADEVKRGSGLLRSGGRDSRRS